MESLVPYTQIVDSFRNEHTRVFLNNHPKRVAYLSLRMGELLGYSKDRMKGLAISALLHDAGKTHSEARPYFTSGKRYSVAKCKYITQLHQLLGPDVIDTINFGNLHSYKDICKIVSKNHHGTRRNRHNLPQENWIVAVSDIWDALTSDFPEEESERGYRTPLGIPDALRAIWDMAVWGKLDIDLTQLFITKNLGLQIPRAMSLTNES